MMEKKGLEGCASAAGTGHKRLKGEEGRAGKAERTEALDGVSEFLPLLIGEPRVRTV